MKTIITFILSLFICNFVLAQQITVSGHIEDINTGEKLSYATIYSTQSGRGTISNIDGNFAMQVDTADVLVIRFIGYEALEMKAVELPRIIKLSPWNKDLPEVTVIAAEDLLIKACKQIKNEYKKHKKDRSQYFLRMNSNYKTQELAEAFVSARSMCNLRNSLIIKGQFGRKGEDGLTAPRTKSMDFHHILEAGPWLEDSEFWSKAISPLGPNINLKFLRKHYDIHAQALRDNKRNDYYRIEFRRKSNYYPNGIVTGKLYMDAKTLRLLRFDGKMEDIKLLIEHNFFMKDLLPVDISFNISYSHDKGYTEISNMSCVMSTDDNKLETKSILFNVDDIDLKTGEKLEKGTKQKAVKGKQLSNNMLKSIKEAGFDRVLWESSNIVMRTKEEEKALGIDSEKEETAAAVNMVSQDSTSFKSSADSMLVKRQSTTGKYLANPKVLLYRISGSDLTHDSYIMGTNNLLNGDFTNKIDLFREVIHSVDNVYCENVLFSNYNGLKDAAKSDSLIQFPADGTLLDVLSKEEYVKVTNYIKNNFTNLKKDSNVKEDFDSMIKLTPGSLLNYFIYKKVDKLLSKTGGIVDLNVPMDLYIQRLTYLINKEVKGLDNEYDTNITKKPINVQIKSLIEFIDSEEIYGKSTNKVTKLYSDMDLDGLFEHIANISMPEELENVVYKRNDNWLNKMPKIMSLGSTLFAVDAIHLGGEYGLLNALRRAGYNVTGLKIKRE